jgi:diguanylate cyclase (GGDEF)-like protein
MNADYAVLRHTMQDAAADESAAEKENLTAAGKARLLIVDDMRDNRAILRRRFERRGFHIAEADGGLAALDMIAREEFDIVLLDMMMPDLDGLKVLARIRAQCPSAGLPVIMVTAKAGSQDIVEALELGANDYITKPVDFSVALARVNTQLQRKRAEDKVRQMNEALRRANEELEGRVAERTKELVKANQQLRKEMEHREKSQATIRYLAHHDALTGLGNRLLFHEQLCEAAADKQQHGGDLAVLFIDLDGFKGINDTLGHSTGDFVLKRVADRLRDTLRDSDKIGRVGGDEFAIILRGDEQPKEATAVASRLIEVIGLPFSVNGQSLIIGASIGIAVADDDYQNSDQLLKAADLAMYRAKADGRGQFRFFEPELDRQAQERRALEFSLRTAVAGEAFEIYYQPLINLGNGRISGFEALLRWEDPKRGVVPPSVFVPMAEEIGLMVPIGGWVLKRACAEAASWPEHIKVAVNLSSMQFQGGDLLWKVKDALAASGLPPSRLELEITESIFLDKSEENLAILNQLRDLGVHISMDDFGTGYSSLSYLRSFPFDKIKIDQSFIHDLSTNQNSVAIVRAVCALGRSFGACTTAEGVETEDQLEQITAAGCTEVQGFLFSEPKPAAEIPALIARLG